MIIPYGRKDEQMYVEDRIVTKLLQTDLAASRNLTSKRRDQVQLLRDTLVSLALELPVISIQYHAAIKHTHPELWHGVTIPDKWRSGIYDVTALSENGCKVEGLTDVVERSLRENGTVQSKERMQLTSDGNITYNALLVYGLNFDIGNWVEKQFEVKEVVKHIRIKRR